MDVERKARLLPSLEGSWGQNRGRGSSGNFAGQPRTL